jgi:CubicO group peptidase (beta-lactamase class C family)
MRHKFSKAWITGKKFLRAVFYTILAVLIILNLFVILSGRFYLYKGVAYTYFAGKMSPDIYERDYFYYSTVKLGETINWKRDGQRENVPLGKDEKRFMRSLHTKAFLVFRGDSILFEEYYDTHKANTVSNSFSAAKTVVALLVGIALEEGKIKSMDEPVGHYVPEFMVDDRRNITIRHLLMMSSGLDWEESGKNPLSTNAESYYGSDLYGLVTRQKPIKKPGKTFIYQSGNSQLLAYVVEKATGKTVSQYLEEKIWKKMGAEHDAYWSLDKKDGDEKAFCCLYASARDFGRLGKLILNKGKVGNEQVVPLWYMNEMFQIPPIGTEEGITNQRYGLHIWHYFDGSHNIYYCRGIKGQYVISIPSDDLVIVRLGLERMDNITMPEKKNLFREERQETERMVGHPKDFFTYINIGRRIAASTK